MLRHEITFYDSLKVKSWEGTQMLRWSLIFFVIALVAALFGFGGIAAGAAGIAQFLFFVFAVIFVISLIMGLFRRAA